MCGDGCHTKSTRKGEDLCKLNNSVRRECYPLLAVEQILAQIAGACVFLQLDTNSVFWQIPLARESSLLTTFITPFSRYRFNRLPFGISSAPEHFQRRMAELLKVIDGVVCLVDGILIHGKTQQEHDERLTAVLHRLRDVNLTLNGEKCKFSCPQVSFLGQTLSAAGIQPDSEKVAAILELREPKDVPELRRFLGMVNQLMNFTPHLAEMTKPLRDLLSKLKTARGAGSKPRNLLSATSKQHLQRAQHWPYSVQKERRLFLLTFPLMGLELLQRQPSGDLRPVAYISRSMSATEQRYAQIEKEALALTWACERFSDYLIGISFHIQTDHKPLVPLLSTKLLDELPISVQRFRMRLLRYNFTITHIPGQDLVTADMLSRAPVSDRTASDQLLEEEVDAYIQAVIDSLPASEDRLAEIREHSCKMSSARKLSSTVRRVGLPSTNC